MKRSLKTFTKNDQAKSRLDLLPPWAIEFVGHCLRYGAIKYAPGNWSKCKAPSRYVAALLRHVMKHQKGEFTDLESGLPHLACAITSGLFALDLYLRGAQYKAGQASMGNYFAIVQRKGKHGGVIRKRFNKFEPAWAWIESQGLDPAKYLVKTVPSNEKVGMHTRL